MHTTLGKEYKQYKLIVRGSISPSPQEREKAT